MGPEPGLVGAIVAQRYELIELIGHGGMGDVYRALDRELDEEVALKIVKDALVNVPGVLERFRVEVKLARRVTHKNVARTYELGRADGLTFFTMELVAGESLTERLRAGPLPAGVAVAIAVELCDALAAAHAVGVVHRDLKPGNVMLTRSGRIIVLDFGVAKLLAADSPARLTVTGAVSLVPSRVRRAVYFPGGSIGPLVPAPHRIIPGNDEIPSARPSHRRRWSPVPLGR